MAVGMLVSEVTMRYRPMLLTLILLSLPAFAQADEIADLFKQVRDSIVVIGTEETVITVETGFRPAKSAGLGSGVLIAPNRVLTAAHVVHTADKVAVAFHDDRTVYARVLSSSRLADTAVLELESPQNDIPVARLGDSDELEVGEQIVVIGAPYGLTYTLTTGRISGRVNAGAVGGDMMNVEYLQTDAAINQGNSGGPMFNLQGEVVGVVSSILSQSGGFEGLGFVVPINVARRAVLDKRPFWLGAEGKLLPEEVAQLLNVPQTTGVMVERVAQNSPAATMGLQPSVIPITVLGTEILIGGDIILSFAGVRFESMKSFADIERRVDMMRAGSEIPVEVLRAGQVLTLSFKLP
jgi:serine protease Do